MLGNDKRDQSEDVNVAERSCHYSCARGNHGSPRLIRGCRLKRLQGFDHEAKSANWAQNPFALFGCIYDLSEALTFRHNSLALYLSTFKDAKDVQGVYL